MCIYEILENLSVDGISFYCGYSKISLSDKGKIDKKRSKVKIPLTLRALG